MVHMVLLMRFLVLVASWVKSSADKALVLGDSWAEYSLETLQDRVSKGFQSHRYRILSMHMRISKSWKSVYNLTYLTSAIDLNTASIDPRLVCSPENNPSTSLSKILQTCNMVYSWMLGLNRIGTIKTKKHIRTPTRQAWQGSCKGVI